jgi:putative ABC transport system substrate-binding protein
MEGNRRRLLGSMGLVLVAPAFSWAQTKPLYRLGMLVLRRLPPLDDAFFAALASRGWSEGRNLQVDVRETASDQERAPVFAAELLKAGADMLVVVSTGNAVAARKATSTVPIVMLGSGFPVEAGLAKTLARPGGNVTGLCVYAGTQLFGKYVTLFKELVPTLRSLGVF